MLLADPEKFAEILQEGQIEKASKVYHSCSSGLGVICTNIIFS